MSVIISVAISHNILSCIGVYLHSVPLDAIELSCAMIFRLGIVNGYGERSGCIECQSYVLDVGLSISLFTFISVGIIVCKLVTITIKFGTEVIIE